MIFLIYLLSVGVYICFLVWCLAPIVRQRGRAWLRRVRVAVGLGLLAGNFIPLLLLPVFLLVGLLGEPIAQHAQATVFFVRTLPTYIENVRERGMSPARIVDIRYPIEIGGVRYAPVVRTSCVYRRAWALDKGISLKLFASYPTAEGGQFLARAGNAIVAIDHAREVCADALRRPVDLDRLQQRGIFVVRGEADQTQFYSLSRYPAGRLEVDDIVLFPPEIVSIAEAPASDLVSLDVLWPMWLRKEYGSVVPDFAQRYMRLSAGVNACVEFVSWNSFDKPPGVRRGRKTHLPQGSEAESATYCRDVLARHIGAEDWISKIDPQP